MVVDAERSSATSIARWVAVVVILAIIATYAALSFIAAYKPDWIPARSILQVAMLGPTTLLVWGSTSTMYWVCTAVLAGTAIIGALHEDLHVPAVILLLIVWVSSGFFSVAMSV
ncbi:hypothetical protein [Pseudoxanthomonas wuyuanensis]|uniref:hypothetical protein n=1 Tax=Pseudoxanthomonas wuyuanensis TaxID=1073196 RepID=UPI0011427C3F|nr:hypothetical protein [Pseudoxanthomonas wuyuanensis]